MSTPEATQPATTPEPTPTEPTTTEAAAPAAPEAVIAPPQPVFPIQFNGQLPGGQPVTVLVTAGGVVIGNRELYTQLLASLTTQSVDLVAGLAMAGLLGLPWKSQSGARLEVQNEILHATHGGVRYAIGYLRQVNNRWRWELHPPAWMWRHRQAPPEASGHARSFASAFEDAERLAVRHFADA